MEWQDDDEISMGDDNMTTTTTTFDEEKWQEDRDDEKGRDFESGLLCSSIGELIQFADKVLAKKSANLLTCTITPFAFLQILSQLKMCLLYFSTQVEQFDVSPEIPGNGLRSFLKVTWLAVKHFHSHLRSSKPLKPSSSLFLFPSFLSPSGFLTLLLL
mmetsp:Transcript_15069/g.23617  ORF Transcript_15069/g.23617 Transcript_15069/m.23617 type:complete len:158 (-) Transcript_15069:163-636(-)